MLDPVTLRMHSEFSLLESMIRISQINRDTFHTAALTDTHNMFSAVRFTKQCLQQNIHPILGCAINIGITNQKLYLYVQNQQGYSNLSQILSDHSQNIPTFDTLRGFTEGLMALLDETSDPAWAPSLEDLFPDRWGVALSKYQPGYVYSTPHELLELATQMNKPLLASNTAYFNSPEDYEAHDAMRCIALGQHVDEPKRKRLSRYQRILTKSEWCELFADAPQAVENTLLWAQKCHFILENQKQQAPSTPQDQQILATKAHEGLSERIRDRKDQEKYFNQLKYELDVINQLGLAGYFLTVADYVCWAKNRGIPTSCRGSGAGSVVAWAIQITDIDPLRFSLVFERFLNPERVSMADFDMDFCQERREEVIQYICDKYGADHVAHIGTFGTLQAKAVLRDVGRVTGMRYTEVDDICKLIPYHPLYPVNLQTARATQPELDKIISINTNVQRLWQLAEKLEGLSRHISTHAAGIVISDKKLSISTPLYTDPNSGTKITQFDMYALEQAGFIKYDILGLNGLTMIQKTIDLLKASGIKCDLAKIPLNDQKIFAYLSTGNSYGIFQLDSIGIREILKQMQPKRFEDLIALNALYRPGPVANIPQYIQNKAHPEQIEYLYPELREILDETHGIIVYQEQVLLIARRIAGFSLGEADILRRAIGKKIESEMQKQRARFIQRATELHNNEQKAEALFMLIEKFSQYGFVKAHATCYAMVMYRMAYLKTHYRIYFICVGMTVDGEHHHKLIQWKREADREKIQLLPPCVMKSHANFQVVGPSCIRYGLRALKNLGFAAAQKICKIREEENFTDPWDFVRRSGVNKQALESLITAGALDIFDTPRETLLFNLQSLLHQPENSLFPPEFTYPTPQPNIAVSYTKCNVSIAKTLESHLRSLRSTGIYIASHPLDNFPLQVMGFAKCTEHITDKTTIIGNVLHIDRKRMKNGNIYGILLLSDPYGIAEVSVFSELWAKMQKTLKINDIIWCKIRAGRGYAIQQFGHVQFEGMPLGWIKCIFDTTHAGLELLTQLPPGNTTLLIQIQDQKWKTHQKIKVDLGALKLLSSIPEMRWLGGGLR